MKRDQRQLALLPATSAPRLISEPELRLLLLRRDVRAARSSMASLSAMLAKIIAQRMATNAAPKLAGSSRSMSMSAAKLGGEISKFGASISDAATAAFGGARRPSAPPQLGDAAEAEAGSEDPWSHRISEDGAAHGHGPMEEVAAKPVEALPAAMGVPASAAPTAEPP